MVEVKFDIENVEEIKAKLSKAPVQIRLGADRALAKIAFLVENLSKQLTPVDTGRLRSSIYTELYPLRATISTNVNYAIYVHEGTEFMVPRPFMQEAVSFLQKDMEEIITEEIRKTLNV